MQAAHSTSSSSEADCVFLRGITLPATVPGCGRFRRSLDSVSAATRGGARDEDGGDGGGAEERLGEEEQRVADGCRPRSGGRGGMDGHWEEVCGAVVVSGGEAGQ